MLGVEADTTGASASAVHSKAGTRPSTADKPDVAAAATATPAASQITLTLWVHSPEQYATTATSTTNIDNASTSTSKRDVKEAADDTGSENATTGPPPLSTALCTEVVLAQELFKDKNSFGIQLQPGDLVEIFKTSVARPGSARPTSSGEHPNPRSSLRSAAALVFKVEKSCIAPDNASSQLQVRELCRMRGRTLIHSTRSPSPTPWRRRSGLRIAIMSLFARCGLLTRPAFSTRSYPQPASNSTAEAVHCRSCRAVL